jgi:REP element-mobilizing transposase RayT
MARKLRVECALGCYHVINRGNYRRDLFAGKRATESFPQCLVEAARRFGWQLHALVIMRNHFHSAVEIPEPNLGDGMRRFEGQARFVKCQADRLLKYHLIPGIKCGPAT